MEKFLVIQSESRGRSKQKYHIAIDDSSVKSNSLYIFPKVSVSRIDPPGYMKMKWFTFSGKKEYYPVIIRSNEETSGFVIDTKRILTMTVKCLKTDSNDDEMPEPYDLECPQNKGLYWFQALRFHISGVFSLKFSCDNFSDTEPLQFEIKVSDENKNKIENSEIISTSVETPATDANSSVIQAETESKRSLRINQQTDKSKGLPALTPSPGINLSTSDVKVDKAPSTAVKSGVKVKAGATPATVSKRKRSSEGETVALDNSSSADHVITEKPLEVDEGATKSTRSTRKSAKVILKEDHDEKVPELAVNTEEIEQVQTEIKLSRVMPDSIISFKNVQPCPCPDTIVTIKTRLDPPPLIPIASSSSQSSSSSSSSLHQNHCLPVHGPRLKASLPQSLIRALLADQVTHNKLCEYAQHTNMHRNATNSTRCFRLPINCRTPSVCDLLEDLKSACDPVLQTTVLYLQHLFEFVLFRKLLYPTEVLAFEDRVASLQSSKKVLAAEFGPYHYLRLLVFVVTEIDASGQDNDRFKCEEEMQKLQQVVDTAVKMLDEKAHVLFY